jgi:hypothetical protein
MKNIKRHRVVQHAEYRSVGISQVSAAIESAENEGWPPQVPRGSLPFELRDGWFISRKRSWGDAQERP